MVDDLCLFPALNVIKCAYITYFEYYTVKTVKAMISSSLEMYLSILNFTYVRYIIKVCLEALHSYEGCDLYGNKSLEMVLRGWYLMANGEGHHSKHPSCEYAFA